MKDIEKKLIMLIGTPLGQSFAARMQNRAYTLLGVNMEYVYCQTGSEHLAQIVEGLRHMPNIAGFAVTKPNKVAVLPLLDRLDPLCRMTGSCNTVVRAEDGTLTGYNTDGVGFIRAIREDAGLDIAGRTFFCIGAGGAGRAICASLAMEGAGKIYVTAAHSTSAMALADHIDRSFCPVVQPLSPGDFSMAAFSDVIINATGIGMGHTLGQSPMPKELMPSGRLYFDAIYNPEMSRFLLDGESAGGRILNGLSMSLYQGAAQIELWTGMEAPVDTMRRELWDILKEKT